MPTDLTTISLNMEPVFIIAGIVLVALMAHWIVRKVILLAKRS